jgi:hypothetical protein
LPPWVLGVGLAITIMLVLFLIGRKDYMKEGNPGAKVAKKMNMEQTPKKKKTTKETKPATKKQLPTPDYPKDGMDRSRLRGYTPPNRLPANTKRVLDEIMTYRDFIKLCPEFEADPRINAMEKVLVVRSSTVNTRGQTLLSTTVYRVPSGSLLLESVKAE